MVLRGNSSFYKIMYLAKICYNILCVYIYIYIVYIYIIYIYIYKVYYKYI